MALALAGCAAERATPPPLRAGETLTDIAQQIPAAVADRAGWAADIDAGLTLLRLPTSRANVCAVIAVVAQESGFQVDPKVVGLARIAWTEIDQRAARVGVPAAIVHGVLQLPSSTGRSYAERIDAATSERDLSAIFDDFVGTVPWGRTLFAGWNPIRTRGPMQVSVTFAEGYAAAHPYPHPAPQGIADELFTRRGGLYFGIAHLLAYPAHYDRYLYRFADFNAGQYSSRNAAFQAATSRVSGRPLIDDGALVSHTGAAPELSQTEAALRSVERQLGVDDAAIHAALALARTPQFEDGALYREVFELADRGLAAPMPRALVPRIKLESPKITRPLTTAWYAERVNGRFESCMNR